MFDNVNDQDISAPFSKQDAETLAQRLGIEFSRFTIDDFLSGLNVELEHRSATHGDPTDTAAIVLEHLAEHPHYYRGLKHMENKLQDDAAPDKIETDSEAAELLGVDTEELDNTISDIFSGTTAEQIVADLAKLATRLDAAGQKDAATAVDELAIRTSAGIREWAANKMRQWSDDFGQVNDKRVQQDANKPNVPATQPAATPGLEIDSANGTVRITSRKEFLPKFKAGLITTMGLAMALKQHFSSDAGMLAKIRMAETASDGSSANRLLDIATQAGLLTP